VWLSTNTGGAGWTFPVRLDGSGPAGPPRVALAGAAPVVLWREGDTGARLLSSDGGAPGPDVGEGFALTGDAAGNILAAWPAPDGRLRAVGYDAAPPRVAPVSGPARLVQRTSGTFAASAVDAWGPVTFAWSLRGGTPTTAIALEPETNRPLGASVAAKWRRPDRLRLAATAIDAAGNQATARHTLRVMRRLTARHVLRLPSAAGCLPQRAMRIRLLTPKGTHLDRFDAVANGRRLARRGRVPRALTLKPLPRGSFQLRLLVTLADGRTVAVRRRFRTCA
jgi:hypothetical protein